jgi:hypothetical protein
MVMWASTQWPVNLTKSDVAETKIVKSIHLNKLESRSVRSREHDYRNNKLWHKGIKYRSCGYWISTVDHVAGLE